MKSILLNRRRYMRDKQPTVVIWNQLIPNGDFSQGAVYWEASSWQVENNTAYVYYSNAGERFIYFNFPWVAQHLYYAGCAIKSDIDTIAIVESGAGWVTFRQSVTSGVKKKIGGFIKPSATQTTRFQIFPMNTPTNLEINDIICIDLTLMFGEGNEPTSAEQFEQWFVDNIGSLDTYYPYNTGEQIKVKYLPKDM